MLYSLSGCQIFTKQNYLIVHKYSNFHKTYPNQTHQSVSFNDISIVNCCQSLSLNISIFLPSTMFMIYLLCNNGYIYSLVEISRSIICLWKIFVNEFTTISLPFDVVNLTHQLTLSMTLLPGATTLNISHRDDLQRNL